MTKAGSEINMSPCHSIYVTVKHIQLSFILVYFVMLRVVTKR